MSASLQLAKVFEIGDLVIKPVLHGLDLRDAGLHARKSTLNTHVIKAVIKYFERIQNGTN